MTIVNGILTIMDKIRIKNIIISKQGETSGNYTEFIELVKRHKINFIIVQAGDKIKIDKTSYFEILWPMQEQVRENILNNNSIVAKFTYRDISLLFTGDIEEIAERKIVQMYESKLKADIIKVAHHGSKTSSIEQFVEKVQPKVALIGVGENNNFGHPGQDIIKRFENIKCNIFRTDKMGEITLKINSKGKVKIKTKTDV